MQKFKLCFSITAYNSVRDIDVSPCFEASFRNPVHESHMADCPI